MDTFCKIFKINELIYGASETGCISPLVGTESVLLKCNKWNSVISHIIQY